MTGGVSEVERERVAGRLRRAEGLLPLSDEGGLGLLDAARVLDRACLLPVRLDSAALRASARAGVLPAVLRVWFGFPRVVMVGGVSSRAGCWVSLSLSVVGWCWSL